MSNDGRAYGDASTLEALGYEPLFEPKKDPDHERRFILHFIMPDNAYETTH